MRVEYTIEQYERALEAQNERRMKPKITYRPLDELEITKKRRRVSTLKKYYDFIATLKLNVPYSITELVECNKDIYIARRNLLRTLERYAEDYLLTFTRYENTGEFMLSPKGANNDS